MSADTATVISEERCRRRPDERSEAAEGAGLDLHEGIATRQTTVAPRSCPRWPKRLSLVSNLGEIVQGRCQSPNQCEYCARLAAVENAELLSLDAVNGVAPTSYLVLTQPSADQSPRSYYAAKQELQRALRREIEGYQAAWLVEFTTGRSSTSGGRRRPHLNGLVKGLNSEDQVTIVRQIIESTWCARQAANPAAQYVAPVQDLGGLARYLALHFLKEAQAPPIGWRGHRFSTTRGYLWCPTPQARKVARDSLVDKRELWRALAAGQDAEQAEKHVADRREVRSSTTWAVSHTPNHGRS